MGNFICMSEACDQCDWAGTQILYKLRVSKLLRCVTRGSDVSFSEKLHFHVLNLGNFKASFKGDFSRFFFNLGKNHKKHDFCLHFLEFGTFLEILSGLNSRLITVWLVWKRRNIWVFRVSDSLGFFSRFLWVKRCPNWFLLVLLSFLTKKMVFW